MFTQNERDLYVRSHIDALDRTEPSTPERVLTRGLPHSWREGRREGRHRGVPCSASRESRPLTHHEATAGAVTRAGLICALGVRQGATDTCASDTHALVCSAPPLSS